MSCHESGWLYREQGITSLLTELECSLERCAAAVGLASFGNLDRGEIKPLRVMQSVRETHCSVSLTARAFSGLCVLERTGSSLPRFVRIFVLSNVVLRDCDSSVSVVSGPRTRLAFVPWQGQTGSGARLISQGKATAALYCPSAVQTTFVNTVIGIRYRY